MGLFSRGGVTLFNGAYSDKQIIVAAAMIIEYAAGMANAQQSALDDKEFAANMDYLANLLGTKVPSPKKISAEQLVNIQSCAPKMLIIADMAQKLRFHRYGCEYLCDYFSKIRLKGNWDWETRADLDEHIRVYRQEFHLDSHNVPVGDDFCANYYPGFDFDGFVSKLKSRGFSYLVFASGPLAVMSASMPKTAKQMKGNLSGLGGSGGSAVKISRKREIAGMLRNPSYTLLALR